MRATVFGSGSITTSQKSASDVFLLFSNSWLYWPLSKVCTAESPHPSLVSPGISWRAWDPWRPAALCPGSQGDLAAPSPRAKPHVRGERCYKGLGAVLISPWPGGTWLTPSKQLVYIMFSLYRDLLPVFAAYRTRAEWSCWHWQTLLIACYESTPKCSTTRMAGVLFLTTISMVIGFLFICREILLVLSSQACRKNEGNYVNGLEGLVNTLNFTVIIFIKNQVQ